VTSIDGSFIESFLLIKSRVISVGKWQVLIYISIQKINCVNLQNSNQIVFWEIIFIRKHQNRGLVKHQVATLLSTHKWRQSFLQTDVMSGTPFIKLSRRLPHLSIWEARAWSCPTASDSDLESLELTWRERFSRNAISCDLKDSTWTKTPGVGICRDRDLSTSLYQR